MERIGIMVHLLHVVVLEHGADHVLRYVTEGILMLAKQVARITPTVDVNLQIFSIRNI